MRCINRDCGKEITAGADFCPYCATKQMASAPKSQTYDPYTGELTKQPPTLQPVARTTTLIKPGEEVLVMRAGEQVWHFEEPEGHVAPGQQRPLLIMDEQAVHLAHTDRRLEPDELLNRVRSIIATQEVPVDVKMVKANWFSDRREGRSRLVACLRDHPYSDIKMIMGVDYLGKWASFQLNLGVEPEPLPLPPEEPEVIQTSGPMLCIIFGALLLLLGFAMSSNRDTREAGPVIAIIGILALIAGIAWLSESKKKETAERFARRAAWEAQQRLRTMEKTVERFSRTFKVDDMRLFCTAMRQVFQTVVDDIVSRGAEVVRIEGGRGHFFEAKEAEPHDTRRADAAGV